MPSANNKFITNEEAVPVIKSEIFSGHENKRFALGVFSPEDILSCKNDSVEQAYLQLRANVYINQTRMLGDEIRRADNTEIDENDEHSTHFVVLENYLGRAAIFACGRIIEKVNNEAKLPIEEIFPESFDTPTPKGSVEISRFIVRHDKARLGRIAKRELMSAGLSHILNNDLGPILAVIEPGFEKDLRLMGIPLKRIAEPKLISKYNDENLGIEVDVLAMRNHLGRESINRMTIPVGSFGYWGELQYSKSEAGK